ncbi:MAG: C4-dicarboxylate TRAP transporter substrate-binding protein [Hyphomicrobiales bacterium]
MGMKLTRRFVLGAAAVAMMVSGGLSPASAIETIKLTAIDGYPARAMWVKEFSSFFLPKVNEILAKEGKYKIAWTEAYGGTIVKPKGVLEGIKLGLGDVGVVTTVFHGDKIPLQAVAYVTPFSSINPKLVAQTVDKLAEKYPQYKEHFAKQNQVYLTSACVLDTYQVFSKKPINKLADMKGLKMAGAGYNLRYVEGIGAAGVGGPLVSYYNKLQTGVVDAIMLWPEAAVTFKIYEVGPHMLEANIGTVNSKAVTVNADTWKKLPDEVKAALKEASIMYRDRLADVAMDRAAAKVAAYKENGGKVVTLSDEQRNEWVKSMPNISKEWADKLEGKGVPAKKILADYMNLLREGGAKPARNWDQELTN